MAQLNFTDIDDTVAERLLHYLNGIWRPQDLLLLDLVENETADRQDYGIGPVVAGRIIARKRELPGWRFTELSQLNGIRGFGQEKLEDLVSTFSLSSAERLRRRLYSSRILLDNFELRVHPIAFDNEADFKEQTASAEALGALVATHLDGLAGEDPDDAAVQRAAVQVREAYADSYSISHLASFAFALWFYHFDQDNWFGFEQIRQPLESYLAESEGHLQAFTLFKGVDTGLLLRSGITVEDLPVVVNQPEQTVYLWGGMLFD